MVFGSPKNDRKGRARILILDQVLEEWWVRSGADYQRVVRPEPVARSERVNGGAAISSCDCDRN
jgi:hypothetical protein